VVAGDRLNAAVRDHGRALASGDAGGDVVLYDLSSGKTTTLHDGSPVDSVAFSPNGNTLVRGDDGGQVNRYKSLLWNPSFPKLKHMLCRELADTNMTRSQWIAYVLGQAYQKTCP
jgi:WD40 repeat protein